MTDLDQLWKPEAPASVRVGEVVDATGKALDVQRLLMRRWGWPKKAAKRAADHFEQRGIDGEGMVIPVSGVPCRELQRRLFDIVPDLLDDLLEGVANRAFREVKDAHRAVQGIEIAFVSDADGVGRIPNAIADEGLLTSILHTIAGRLGKTIDEIRDRSDFHRDGGKVTLTVWVE